MRSKQLFLDLVIAGVLLALLATSLPARTEAGGQQQEDLETLGRTLAQQMAAREFDKVVSRFDETMTRVMPAPKLAEVWDTVQKQVGDFQKITGTRTDTVNGYRRVIVTCAFAQMNLDVRIVLAADGRVTGLFFAAAQPTGTSTGQQQGEDVEAVGRALVEWMAAGEFEKVVSRFDATMTERMPAPRLAELWDTVQKQTGKFQKITGTRHDTVQSYRRAIVTCVFGQDINVDVRWVLAADGRVAGLSLAPATSAVPWAPPAYATPASFEERAFTVGNGKWQLPGTLTLPKGKGPFAAVVLVHGSGPNDQDESIGANKVFKDLAWGLASRNVAVLRYDKRTKVHGAEMMAQPGGITVNEETVDDAVTAVGQLAAMPEIDRKHIYVLGHSLGAMMAPRIAEHAMKNAAANPLAGLILMAGTTRPLEEIVVEQVRYLGGLDGKISDDEQKQIADAEEFARAVRSPELKPDATLRMLGIPIPGSYFLDLRDYHPAEEAAKLKLPMLVLQGERDYQVRMTDFAGWKKALDNKRNVTLKSYPELNHLFMAGTGPSTPREYSQAGHVAEEVIKDIADWIRGRGAKK